MLVIVLALVGFGAWVTDLIGVHAVLGGFLIGAAMPRGLLASELRRRLEPGVVWFLVPVFFAFAGLNTQLGLLGGGGLWIVATTLLIAAIIGKGVACWAAARLTGEEPRTACAIGALMNARGLMELLVANIGLQQGVIQPAMFSMLVLMAVLTTLMTSPLLKRFHFETVAGTIETKPGVERVPRRTR